MSFAFRYFHPNPGWNAAPSAHPNPAAPAVFQQTADKDPEHAARRNPEQASAHGADKLVFSPDPNSHPSIPCPPITDTVGKHCILELYECDCTRLDDEQFVRAALTNAALRAGATLLNLISHRFQPHGVTGLALLAESHISFHSWPESGYAAVDVFTCGDHTMPESACRVLVEEFGARHHSLRSFRRETPGMIAGLERQPVAGDVLLPESRGLG